MNYIGGWREEGGSDQATGSACPWLLFCCSLLMFGLVDFIHAYDWSSVLALSAGVIIFVMWGPHVFIRHDQHHGAV